MANFSTIPWQRRLSSRMLFWTVGVAGLILIAVVMWNHVDVRNRLETDAQDRARFLAEGAASGIDARLGVIQGLAQGMAITLSANNLAISHDQVHWLQTDILRNHPEIYGLAVSFTPEMKPATWPHPAPYAYRDGTQIRNMDLSDNERAYTSEDWFVLPRYLERPSWSEPYLETTGVKMVTYSVPFYWHGPQGRLFAGVVTCDIDLGWLDRLLAELPLGKDGYGVLMTRNGTFISHPKPGINFNETIFSVAEARNDHSLRQTGLRMVSGQPGLVPWVNWTRGEDSWLAWMPIKTADWIMCTVVSKSELRAEILRHSRDALLVGVAGLLLLFLAVWLIGRSITRPVQALSESISVLSLGNLDAPLPPPRGRDEVALLTAAFAAMRDRLKQYIADLQETTAVRERMNGELRAAHDIQMDLVPKTFPAFPQRSDMDLHALMEPAREVGGDFYDFFLLNDDRLVIAIGDVSGKGVPAALFMAVTRSFLRSAFKADADPGHALDRVNMELSEGNASCMFVTLFCAVVHLADGKVHFANAGHNPPVRLRAGAGLEWIAKPSGPAAGVMPGVAYKTGDLQLAPGEALLLYTDGVTESMNPENAMYGTERLATCLEAVGSQGCEACLGALLADIRSHAAGAEQSDDITLLMLRWTPAERAEDALHLEMESSAQGLGEGLERLDRFLEVAAAPEKLAYAARLVFEEMVTNTVKYGYDDRRSGRIVLDFRLGPPAAMVIEDDGLPFDPLNSPGTPDLNAPVDERPIGGLGLHMVRSVTASMEYRREGNRNWLALGFPV